MDQASKDDVALGGAVDRVAGTQHEPLVQGGLEVGQIDDCILCGDAVSESVRFDGGGVAGDLGYIAGGGGTAGEIVTSTLVASTTLNPLPGVNTVS